MSTNGGRTAIFAAMAANAGIAIAKFIAFLVTGSASMLAESIHSAADTSNQGLLLIGGRRARRVADDQHQFGYGRERYFWGFVVALVLFTLGGVYSVFEGVSKILDPHEVESVWWAIGVILVAMAMDGSSLLKAASEARDAKGEDSWWGYIRRTRSPELPVVLLEDSGALVGLLLALAGVGLAAVTGDAMWDGIGTVGIGVLLIVIAGVLTVEMQSLLIGEAANQEDILALTQAVEACPPVTRIIDLRTQHIGPDELLVAGKIEFDRSLSNKALTLAIDEVESAIRSAVPIAGRIYIEPDIFDPDQVDDGAERGTASSRHPGPRHA